MHENRLGGLLFLAAVILVFLLIWSKVRIVIWVPLRTGGFLILVGGLILVVYFFLRLLFGRR